MTRLEKRSRRHSVIFYSQCDNMPLLPGLAESAGELDAVLRDPEIGACRAGHPSGRSVWGDTADEPLERRTVHDAVEDAIRFAGEQQAQLVLAFLGHGFSGGASGVYFMCTHSQIGDPTSAVRVDQQIELAANAPNIDGVLAFIDTCFAAGAAPSTSELANGVRQGRTRVGVLMSSGISEPSFGLTFTAELTRQLTSGIAGAGPTLYPAAVHQALADCLQGQHPTLSTYLAGQPIHPENLGLPVCHNRQALDSWGGTLDVEWVRELTGSYCDTPSWLAIQTALASNRLVHLQGPAGSGKSTLLAGMTRDKPGGRALDALVFCEARHTPAAVAERISAQLGVTLRGNYLQSFLHEREMAEKEAGVATDAWQVALVQPLASLAGARATIGIDAVDQLDSTTRISIFAAIDRLLQQTPVGIKIITSSRDGAESDVLHRATVVRPQRLDQTTVMRWLNELAEPAEVCEQLSQRPWDGNHDWLLARLLLDLRRDGLPESDFPVDLNAAYELIQAQSGEGWPGERHEISVVEAILAAVGPSPVPLTVVKAAADQGGLHLSTPDLRDLLGQMRHTVVRIQSGTPAESVRVLHSSYIEHLVRRIAPEDVRSAHRWLFDALDLPGIADQTRTGGSITAPFLAYGLTSLPRHALGAERFDRLVAAVAQMHDARGLFAADRRDDWRRWTELVDSTEPEITGTFPEVALELRWRSARWTGEAGNPRAAYRTFTDLLEQARAVYQDDHWFVLSTRHQLARYTARIGEDAAAARAFAELLKDRERLQGPEHKDTLKTALDLARWRGYQGDPAGASAMVTELLPRMEATLRPQSRLLLRARGFLARWRGDSGEPGMALAELRELQHETESLFGRHHPDTLDFRHSLAWWTGRAGDPAEAARMLQDLVLDSAASLGPTDKDTLIRRRDLARWRGDAGDPAGAVALLTDLIPDLRSCLDEYDHDVLDARHSLAWWTSRTGDTVRALALLEELQRDCRQLGTTHPHAFNIRLDLARLRGDTGDAQRAAAELADLVSDMEEAVGLRPDDVFNARHTLAWWTGCAGDPGEAVRLLTDLLADRLRIHRPDDPDCLDTRRDLAYWTDRCGDPEAAVEILTRLPDHDDSSGRRR